MNGFGRKLGACRRFSVIVAISAAALSLVFLTSSTAKADPHAVFYTAIGQQQLFFNVLAALDQADYVEPATQDKDGQNSRESLLIRRQGAPGNMIPESDPTIKATKTELSSVVTRPITLEGEDQWTAYLQIIFAEERRRRKDMYDILKVFCERGLGVPGCDPQTAMGDPTKSARMEDYALNAFPELGAQGLFENGVAAAAASGTSEDTQKRKDLLAEQNSPKGSTAVKPMAYAPDIAGLRREASNMADFVNGNIYGIASTFKADTVISTALKDLTVDSNGKVRLSYDLRGSGNSGTALAAADNLSGPAYLARTAKLMDSITQMPSRIQQTLEEAQNNHATQMDAIINDNGVKSDYQVIPQIDPATGQIGNLTAHIDMSSAIKEATGQKAVTSFVDAALDPKFANPQQESVEGNTDSFTISLATPGQAAGIMDNKQVLGVTNGQVLGTGSPGGSLNRGTDPKQTDQSPNGVSLKPIEKDSKLADIFNIVTHCDAYGGNCRAYYGSSRVSGVKDVQQPASLVAQNIFFSGLNAVITRIKK